MAIELVWWGIWPSKTGNMVSGFIFSNTETSSPSWQPDNHFLQDEHYKWTFNVQWPSSWCGGEYDHQRLATWRVGSFSETLRHRHQVDNHFLQDEHYKWTFNVQWPSSWCGGEYDHQRLATWRVGSFSETLRHRHQVDNQTTIFYRMNIISELLMFNGHRAVVMGNMTIKDCQHGEYVHFQKQWDIITKSTTRQPFFTGWTW